MGCRTSRSSFCITNSSSYWSSSWFGKPISNVTL